MERNAGTVSRTAPPLLDAPEGNAVNGMNLQARLRKLEARAFPPEPQTINVHITHYDDGPLPAVFEYLTPNARIVVTPERYTPCS